MKTQLRSLFFAASFVLASSGILLPLVADNVSAAGLAKGQVTWSLTNSQVTAGTPTSANLRYMRMPAGSRLELVVESGPLATQRVLQRYPARGQGSRAITLPGMPMGSYRFRVIAIYSNGRFMTGSSWQKLYSYGTVSLNALCRAQGAIIGGDGCQGGAVQVGSNLFAFAIEGNVDFNKPPIYGTIVNFPATTCRSLSLEIALDSANAQPGDSVSVQVIEGTLAPQFVTVVQGAITTFDVTLDGGPFFVQDASIENDYVFYGGTGSCWSSTGE
jgi:hypothetical protein